MLYDLLRPFVAVGTAYPRQDRTCGKIPSTAAGSVRLERELEDLRRQLNEAIAAQEYEKCAALRDRIRELEGGADHE